MIKYEKMNLFDAPKESVLVHACNSRGTWGAGIAREFKNKFPNAFYVYNKQCKIQNYRAAGTGVLIRDDDYYIGCLITSMDYGLNVSTESDILDYTTKALDCLLIVKELKFYSNKFNSGLFRVPWEKTEIILNDFVNKHNIDWTVCDYTP